MTCLILMSGAALLATDVVQTQESDRWDGIEVDLTKLSIRNNIITLRFKIRNTGEKRRDIEFYYKDCYLIDEANQKKYYVLKDSEGQFIGGPKDKEWEGGRFSTPVPALESNGLWMKFPLPTDDPESISISLPGFFPFEEIVLQ